MPFAPSTVLVAPRRTPPMASRRVPLRAGCSWAVLCALLPLVGWAAPARAEAPVLPTGGSFVAGQGSISTAPGSMTVDQFTRTGVIDWQSFSIGHGAGVTFNNGTGATLNRVTGGDLTRILGSLSATGSVYVVNPQGVVVGAEGAVTVGGAFVASTLDVATAAFMAGGTLRFQGSSPGSITNLGRISATGGDVVLIAREVTNAGRIDAPNGTAALAAGSEVWLRDADGPASVLVQGPGGDVTNTGTVEAARAELAAAGGNVFALAGDNGGIVRATGTERRNGRVVLSAGAGVTIAGTVQAADGDGTGGAVTATGQDVTVTGTGRVDVSGSAGGGTAVLQAGQGLLRQGGTVDARGTGGRDGGGADGGTVHLLGDRVQVASGALVDATGTGAGGTVLVGGDYLGGRDESRRFAPAPLPNARRTAVEAGATLRADGGGGSGAGRAGTGGAIVVWSDEATRAAGTISARGGDAGGDGGFVEASGKQFLDFRAAVDLAAPRGQGGTLLLDPQTLTIRASNPDLDGNGVFGDDLLTATDLSSPLNFGPVHSFITSGQVAALLNAGANVLLTASHRITVESSITMTGATTASLGMETGGDIVFMPGVSIRATGAARLNMQFRAGLTNYGGGPDQGQITTDFGGSGEERFESNGGNINFFGYGGATVADGIRLENTIIDAGGGNVHIEGLGGTTNTAGTGLNRGVMLGWGTRVTTGGGGNITIIGTGGATGSGNHGIQIDPFTGAGSSVANTGWGGVTLVGTAGAGSSHGLSIGGAPDGSPTVDGGTGWLTLRTDRLHIATPADGYANAVRIAGTGALFIEPVTTNRNLVVGGARDASDLFNLRLDDNLLAALQDGFWSITIGNAAHTGHVTINSAAFRDDVTIGNGAGTGDLTLVGALSTGSGAEAGHITLMAGRNLAVNQGASIVTQNRNITLVSNRDGVGTGWIDVGLGGGGTTILRTNGGDLVMGGGADPLTQAALGGGRNSHFDTGIALRPGTQLLTDGGNVSLRGQGAIAATLGQAHGIGVQGNVLINSGTGAITMVGTASPAFSNPAGADFGSGINFFDFFGMAPQVSSQRATGAAITLTGVNSGTSGDFLWGVNIQGGTVLSALGGGDIVISGTGGGATGANSHGIQLNGNSILRTGTGNITLTGSHGNAFASGISSASNEQIGVLGTTQGNITLTADRMALNAATVRTSGAVTLRPLTTGLGIDLGSTAGAGPTLNLSSVEINRVTAGSLTIGGATAGAITVTQPIAPTGTNALRLWTGGAISQSAALTIANLAVTAAGNVTLPAGNAITTLSGSAGGAIDVNAVGALAIGNALAPSGLSAGGNVRVTASGGALTITAGAGVSAGGTGDALVLAANGLFHNLAGAGALTVTGGGRWLVFSQTPAGGTRGGLPGLALYNRPFDFSTRTGGAIANSGNRFAYPIAPVLTVTAPTATAVYGSPTPLTASITGLIGDDTLADAVSGAPVLTGGGTNAGTYVLTPGIGTLSSDLGYGFSLQPGTLTITRAPLTVTANSVSTVYGTAPVLGVGFSGFVAGDTAATALTGALTFAGVGTNAGVHTITPGGLSAANYDITYAPGTLTITRAPLTVTANSVSTVYGTAPMLGVGFSGFVAGDTPGTALTGAPTFAGVGTNAGVYTITPGGLSAANYDITYAPGTLTITRAPLTVTANSVSTVYGTAPALGVGFSGFVAGDTAATALTGALTFAGVGTNAGVHTIMPGGLSAANYDITYAPGTLTITRAPLTVTANSVSTVYGTAPALGVGFSGFVAGDTAATALTGGVTFAGVGTNAGVYTITPGGLSAANYDITYAAGQLTITRRPVTYEVDPVAVSFGVPPAPPPYRLSNLLAGDQVTGRLMVTDALGQPVDRSSVLAPGSYLVRVAALEGAAAANYILADSGHTPGTISIAPRLIPPVVLSPPPVPALPSAAPTPPTVQVAERPAGAGAPAQDSGEEQEPTEEAAPQPTPPVPALPVAVPGPASVPAAASLPVAPPSAASPDSRPAAPAPAAQLAALPPPTAEAPSPGPQPGGQGAGPGPLSAAAQQALPSELAPSPPAAAAAAPPIPAPVRGPELAQGTAAAAATLAGPAATAAERATATASVDQLVGALLARGGDPAGADAVLQQVAAQQAAAQVRSGPATPAQAMGDTLSRGGLVQGIGGLLPDGATGVGAGQLAAALAAGLDPAAAIDRAVAAAEAAQAQRAAAAVATGPGADRLAAVSAGGPVSPDDPGARAAADALARGLSAEDAAAAARTAAETLARMQELATLPPTPESRAAAALAAGGIEGLLPLDAAGRPDPVAADALSAALARGADMATALAEALRAADAAAEVRRLSEVPVSDSDRAAGGLAAGRVEDAAGACVAAGLCDDPAPRDRQLEAAAVAPDLLMPGLATGQLPPALLSLAERENEAGALALAAALLAGADFDTALRQGADMVAARNRMLAAATVPGGDATIYAVPQALMEQMAGTTDPAEVMAYAAALVQALKRDDDTRSAKAAGQAAILALRRGLATAGGLPPPAPPLTAGGP